MTLRSGAEFLQSLDDEREVWIDGRRVRRATEDPALRGAAQTLAMLFDLQRADAQSGAGVLTALGDGGQPVPRATVPPRSIDEVRQRGRAFKAMADATCGLFGRTPDFMNAGIAALAAAGSVFDEHGGNGRRLGDAVRAYHRRTQHEDLCLTHVQVNPPVDRSKKVHEQAQDIALKVVRETDAGFVVNGSRWVGTLAQLAHEVVVMPSVVIGSEPGAEDYAFAFALPMATPGIKVISRPSVVPQGAGHWLDNPLANQYDEGDAVIVFDSVFVPWERTFVYRDPALCNKLYKLTCLSEHYSHQTMTRSLAKAEFMAALATFMARSTKVDGFPNVQQQLAELYLFVEAQAALVERAENRAQATPFGTWAPDRWPLHTAQLYFFERYARMIDIVRAIGAGGLVGVPSFADTQGPIAEMVGLYFASAGQGAQDRIQLMRLAADAATSAFAGRQVLYERYYQGDPVRRAIAYCLDYPKDAMLARMEALMAEHRALARAAGSPVA